MKKNDKGFALVFALVGAIVVGGFVVTSYKVYKSLDKKSDTSVEQQKPTTEIAKSPASKAEIAKPVAVPTPVKPNAPTPVPTKAPTVSKPSAQTPTQAVQPSNNKSDAAIAFIKEFRRDYSIGRKDAFNSKLDPSYFEDLKQAAIKDGQTLPANIDNMYDFIVESGPFGEVGYLDLEGAKLKFKDQYAEFGYTFAENYTYDPTANSVVYKLDSTTPNAPNIVGSVSAFTITYKIIEKNGKMYVVPGEGSFSTRSLR
jgi:hypothetical protein